MKFLTKKMVFGFHLFSFFIFCLCLYVYNNDLLCGTNWGCYDAVLFTAYGFLSLIILLLPSIITFPFDPNVFTRWKKFAMKAVPVVLVVTFITTSGAFKSGSGLGGIGIDLGPLVLGLLYGWFVIHSLILIIYTSIKSRRG